MHTLNARLKHWASWGLPSQPRLLKTFSAGQNHTTILVETGHEHWVIKQFEHSFEPATHAQRWAASHTLAPPIRIIEPDLAIMPYIDTVPYTSTQLSALAAVLSALHQTTDADLTAFDLLGFCEQYLQGTDSLTQQQHRNLLPALQIYLDDDTEWCACHNDLVQSNCLFTDQRVWLIDWEYAMQHNPWFDLAAVVLYFELDSAASARFLRAYRNDWSATIKKPIFYASQLALLWADLLWHLNKYGSEYRVQHSQRFTQLESLQTELQKALSAQAQ